MQRDWYEIIAAFLGFAGGGLLSLEAIFGTRRIYQESGKTEAQKAAEAAGGKLADPQGHPIFDVRLWFAQRAQTVNRAGFLLVTAGFLVDLVDKWKK